MRVSDLLHKTGDRIVSVSPGSPLEEAMHLMAMEKVGTVIILEDDGTPKGLMSERDFVRIFETHGRDAIDLPVCDLISRKLITCDEDATLDDVLSLMSDNGIRHLPVERNGKLVGMVSARDVLDAQHHVMQQIMKRKQQAYELVLSSKQRAEQADRQKTEFLANMSHELKTPLNAVIGFSGMIEEESCGPVGTDKYIGYANAIRTSGEHLLYMINEILDMARLQMGTWQPTDELLELHGEVFSSVKEFETNVKDKSQHIAVAPVTHMIELVGDARMLHQMIGHLLSNAVKFTPEGGDISIEFGESPDGELLLSVTDTGVGMDPDVFDLVRQPFRQVDGSLTRPVDGAGLGLALADTMMRLHGGALDIESGLGEGTRVTLRFPKDRRPVRQLDQRQVA
ncbi:MAG: ATP-binding protein [Alphaproteobacteria bacterium]